MRTSASLSVTGATLFVACALTGCRLADPEKREGTYTWTPNEVEGQLVRAGTQCVRPDNRWQPHAYTQRKAGQGGVQVGELTWKIKHNCAGAVLQVGNLRRLTVCGGSTAANCTPTVTQCLPSTCPPPALTCGNQTLAGTSNEFKCDVTNAVDGLYKYDLKVRFGTAENTYDPVIEIGDWTP